MGVWLALIYGAIPWARQIQEYIASFAGGALSCWITGAALFNGLGGLIWAHSRQILVISPSKVVVLAAIAALYGWLVWQLRSNPEEIFHCIQYSVLAGLLFRAFRQSLSIGCAALTAAMAGLCCGILDELIQWFVPARYFDYRDIGINAAAVILALVGLSCGCRSLPPSPPQPRVNWLPALCLATANFVLLLLCVSGTGAHLHRFAASLPWLASIDEVTAEYGYKHRSPAGDTLYSRFDREELARQDRLRFAEVAPLLDQYKTDRQYNEFLKKFPAFRHPLLVEARIHLFRRDRYALLTAQAGHDFKRRQDCATIAVGENRLLETYFPNTLRHSSYRWHPSIKARLAAASNNQEPYHSPVSSSLITIVTQQTLQTLLMLASSTVVLSLVLLLAWKNRRSPRQPGPPG